MEGSKASVEIVCNLDALTPDERERRSQTAIEIRDRAMGLEEVEAGFRVRLPNEPESCTRALELILLERRCCPFLSFELAFEPGEGEVRLTVGGPAGVKQFLRENGILGCALPSGGTSCC
jgi:hypothetical protein